MIHIQHSLRISGSALAMSYDGINKIAVIDNGYNLYFFNKTSLELLRRHQLSSKYDLRHKFEKSMSISSKLDVFLSTPKSKAAFLLSTNDGLKHIAQITSHTAPQTTAKFSLDGSILAVGDESGMTLIYKLPSGRLLTTLKKKPDYISAISISNDNRYIAVSSFDKSTMIYDFEYCKYIADFTTYGVVEQSIFSDDTKEIHCIDRSKNIYKYTIENDKLSCSEDTLADWPTSIINIGQNHLLIGSKDNHIHLVSRKDLLIQQIIELPNYGISSLLTIDNLLLVGFVDGEIKVINMQKYMEEFQIAITLNKFEEATGLINKNSFLVVNEMFSKYDEKWPEILIEAKEYISTGEKLQAIKLAKPFFIDKNKEDEFQFCLGNAKHLAIFQKLVTAKEYVKAMLVAEEKEFLKKTDEYKAVENAWYRAFQVAKELIAENKIESTNKAKEILQKFSAVKSKTETINNLFMYSSVYVEANKYIKEKKFKAYFILVQENKFLESEDIYRRMLMLGSQTFDKMKKYEYEENIDEAIKIAEYLKIFLPMLDSIEKELDILYAKKAILAKIEKNDIYGVYKTVETVPALENFKAFREFHTTFVKLKNNALELAQEANIKGCIAVINHYLTIPYLAQAVFKTIKTAYISEIEKALESEQMRGIVDWKETSSAIGKIIGYSDEVLLIYKKYNIETFIDNTYTNDRDTLDPGVELADTVLKFLPLS